MATQREYADYIASIEGLTAKEQEERLTEMRTDEITYRARLMSALDFDKEITKDRIRKNIEWAHELGTLPPFYKSVDSLVDGVYSKLK